MSKPNVLIFTSNAGGGHLSISQAMKETIALRYPQYHLIEINTTPEATSKVYQIIGSQFTKSFGNIWKWSDSPDNAAFVAKLYLVIDFDKTLRLIKKYQPKLIVTTEPVSIHTVQQAIERSGLKIPHLVTIADPFTIHHLWTYEHSATKYLAPTKEAREILELRNIPKENIIEAGWPIRQDFYQKYPIPQAIPLPIFVGGSGEGQGNIYNFLAGCAAIPIIAKSAKFYIVCGHNTNLENKIKHAKNLRKLNMSVYAHVKNLAKIMAKCQIVVGKPGPNILFESIMLGKPFIATGEPLIQELGNYDFIDKKSIGYGTTNVDLAIQKLRNVIESPQTINKFNKNLLPLQKKQIETPKKILQVLAEYL